MSPLPLAWGGQPRCSLTSASAAGPDIVVVGAVTRQQESWVVLARARRPRRPRQTSSRASALRRRQVGQQVTPKVWSYSFGGAASKVIRLDSGAAPFPGTVGTLSESRGLSTLAPASSSSSSMLGQTGWSSTLFSRSLRAFRASCLGQRKGAVTLGWTWLVPPCPQQADPQPPDSSLSSIFGAPSPRGTHAPQGLDRAHLTTRARL